MQHCGLICHLQVLGVLTASEGKVLVSRAFLWTELQKLIPLSLFKITYLWLCWVSVAMCGLSPVVAKRGYSWVAVVLTATASPVVELGSRVTGFRSCGSWALEGRLRATVHQLGYRVLCVGRWVLHHWANREALSLSFKVKIWHNFIMVLPIKIQSYGFLCL